jgi:transposase
LEAAERDELLALTRNGKTSRKEFVSARALLLCDQGPHGPAWTVNTTAEALGVTTRTIEHIKRRFIEGGVEAALRRESRQRKPRAVTFDSAFEARLVALACSEAPSGRRRWTVRLLAEKAVELGLAASVSPMSVQRILKKTDSSLT